MLRRRTNLWLLLNPMARSGLQKIFFVMIGLFLWMMTQLHPYQCEVLLANPDHIVEKAVYRSCPLQQNGFDCGLFAFGCVLHLLKGLDVSADIFNQQRISKLRESLHAVSTLTDIGSDFPNPRELLSSSFLCSFFPLQSENDCHDEVFLRLLQDLPNDDNDIDAAPDVPDKAPLLELDDVPINPRLGSDPQPEPTRHRDNYFTTQFIEVPKEFEDMSKVDLITRKLPGSD
ncbi:hypothetical protein IV203_005355 [Nitzschia inconspicua]|uniref:Uncharacterized protein n=1 Tax=Nitzschia inconspicua TaxID=303405 RepID=A0A9K3PG04_9STRA|nr:hypothetical protein IV203_005355 [Nitzschia inconspicua]